jgi:hypothetical protein
MNWAYAVLFIACFTYTMLDVIGRVGRILDRWDERRTSARYAQAHREWSTGKGLLGSDVRGDRWEGADDE